jgi:integrase
MLEQKVSASGWIPDSGLTSIGRQAYDEVLGHLRSKYTARHDPALLWDVNEAMCDMFAILEVAGGVVEPTAISRAVFDEAGEDPRRLENLRAALSHYGNGRTAIAETTVSGLLEQHGIPTTGENIELVRQSLIPVFRRAFETAGERLAGADRTDAEGAAAAHAGGAAPSTRSEHASSVSVATVSTPSMTLTEAMEACIQHHLKDGAWREDSCLQVRTAIRMFVFKNGDLRICDLAQHHLGAFASLCHALPTKWNRTTEQRKRGLEASLERAATLSPDLVGLSAKSRDKHFTWLESVIKWAGSHGHGRPAEKLDFKSLREGKKAKVLDNELRISWTEGELRTLFSGPVWTGSAGLFDRLNDGGYLWHDAWYWGPIGLALTGFRLDEFIGCSLDEVKEDDPIPHFALRNTTYRDLKNLKSARKLPIPPELIRLGFIGYVEELRRLDQELLFPEMYSPGNKSGFDSTFLKTVFSKLRAHAFPHGTAWFQENGGVKEKDVHSLRGSAANLLLNKIPEPLREDILGHRGASETRKTYDEASALPMKLEALEKLSSLTAHLKVHPLNLRPTEWLRFGQPRGRPANGGRASIPRRPARSTE